MSIFDDAASHLHTSINEARFALGSLDMATGPEISLMGGYTGAQVAKQIRDAKALLEKAQERLRALDTAGKVGTR